MASDKYKYIDEDELAYWDFYQRNYGEYAEERRSHDAQRARELNREITYGLRTHDLE